MEKVIYLSFAQGQNINGPLLAQNISSVMIRGGQGIWKDPLFDYNYKLCVDNHIPFGIWWFNQPNMKASYQIDAFMLVWNSLEVKPVVIAYDVEEIDYYDDNGKLQKLFPPSRQFSHDNILAWCKAIKSATNGKVGIYTRKNYFESWTFETSEWYQFWMWIAAWYLYTGEVPPALPWKWSTYKLHQFAGGGLGTPGVDPAQTCKEYFNGTHQELLDFFGNGGTNNMSGIYKQTIPMADRAWVMEVKSDQKVTSGISNLGLDAVILPMVNTPWDGNHSRVLVEPTFAGRFAESKSTPVFGKIEIDAGLVTTEQHTKPELDGHTIWQNFYIPRILDAWHIGPWTQSNLKPADFLPLKALVFEQLTTQDHQTPARQIQDSWQAYMFQYVVDKLRVLMTAGAIPTIPIILKTNATWLQKYPVDFAIMLNQPGRKEWLYLMLSDPKLDSTSIMADLYSIFMYAPGDTYKYPYVPDGYDNRVVLYEFTAGKQRMAFATGTAYLSKAFSNAKEFTEWMGGSVVIVPPPVEPPVEPPVIPSDLESRILALETKIKQIEDYLKSIPKY